jgi:hypothetical protein
MIRPMTSEVSALSGFVANGHQAIHTFPLPPLKFRTVGFPQYGFKRAVSRALRPCSGALPRPQWRSRPCAFSFRSRACAQAARTVSDTTHPPSGPWLLRRLFCPPASSLTMATSELLPATAGFGFMPTAPRRTEGPQFTLPELEAVPPSLLRWFQDADRRVCAPDLAFAHPVRARQPLSPLIRITWGLLTKRQHSLNAAARPLAGPAPDGTFTAELACGRSPFRTSAMTT